MVDAYLLESKEAIYPRIIIHEDVKSEIKQHILDFMIFKDYDGKYCLNFFKSFGRNKKCWIEKIKIILDNLEKDIEKQEYN